MIEVQQQIAYQNLLKNNNNNYQYETKKSQLATVLEKIAETTNSKDSRSKSEKSLEQSSRDINNMLKPK